MTTYGLRIPERIRQSQESHVSPKYQLLVDGSTKLASFLVIAQFQFCCQSQPYQAVSNAFFSRARYICFRFATSSVEAASSIAVSQLLSSMWATLYEPAE